MKILNLYAGIGGNRMLWGNEHEITAVENVPEVAAIYKHLFPNDNVVIDDAHEYLRKHFREFDFIWASPPCPTHSVLNGATTNPILTKRTTNDRSTGQIIPNVYAREPKTWGAVRYCAGSIEQVRRQ